MPCVSGLEYDLSLSSGFIKFNQFILFIGISFFLHVLDCGCFAIPNKGLKKIIL